MENRRFILIALLGVVIFFLYQAWQSDYAGKQSPPVTSAPVTTDVAEVTVPGVVQAPSRSEADAPAAVSTTESGVATPTAATLGDSAEGARILIITDVVRAEISLRGGELRRLELIGYPVSKKDPTRPMPLLADRDGQFFVVQSGIAGTLKPLASGETMYVAQHTEYRLGESQETMDVVLDHQADGGVVVRKTYRFERGSYEIFLAQAVENNGMEAFTASPYSRLQRNDVIVGDLPKFTATFLGVGFYEKKSGTEDYRFKKVSLDDLDDEAFETRQAGGWIAMLQHYFVAAILPPLNTDGVYSAKLAADGTFAAQFVGAGIKLEPGARQSFETRYYLGPKLQSGLPAAEVSENGFMSTFKNQGLDNLAPGLDYTVDYGILTPLCEPLFWLLNKFHALTGNWGVAIILLTLLVKALFYKLSEAQYRSMAKMKKFAPRIQDMKERYAGDRERMSKAMMDLYKKEGFNPLAGCWPLLLQFPVFIALYWVLLESVELRQADFWLWISDLSAPDPLYVLPVLFGVTFYLQQKWSGATATMDPTQQKIMNVMPIMMTAFFAFFQAGLVLYWLVSNLIGMSQQWLIKRRIEGDAPVKAKEA